MRHIHLSLGFSCSCLLAALAVGCSRDDTSGWNKSSTASGNKATAWDETATPPDAPQPPSATELIPPSVELIPASAPDTASYPSTDQWDAAGERQRARAERSFAVLRERRVPAYSGPLFVEDDDEVQVQHAAEVAKRALILWAVSIRAEGTPREEAIALIKDAGAWDSVSPEEKEFLETDTPDPQVAQGFVWRLESLWVMLWALGHVNELAWPDDMCNVPRLVEVMRVEESNADFIREAKLRDVSELLDAQDLAMRIHWAIRDASLAEPARVPNDLDWSGDAEWVEIPMCAGVGVVEERHHALNWLVNFLKPKNWDEVDTPT